MEKLAQSKKIILEHIKSIDLKEWGIRLISIFLATVLWYFITGEDKVDLTISVPVEIINLPSNMVIANKYKKDIQVTLRGPRSIIKDLPKQHITRSIDLSKINPGTLSVRNTLKSINFPNGINVLRVQPTNISLEIDELSQKKLPIEAIVSGKPATGYELENIQLVPDHITVTGAKTKLTNYSYLKTLPIRLDNLDKTIKRQVSLDLNEELSEMLGETVVLATINIKEKMLKKMVRGIPINVRNAREHVAPMPKTVKVEAEIPENLIRDTPELAMLFRAWVEPDSNEFPHKVVVNVGGITVPGHDQIKVLSIQPKEVTLKEKKEKNP